jgi:hypothetical protein
VQEEANVHFESYKLLIGQGLIFVECLQNWGLAVVSHNDVRKYCVKLDSDPNGSRFRTPMASCYSQFVMLYQPTSGISDEQLCDHAHHLIVSH